MKLRTLAVIWVVATVPAPSALSADGGSVGAVLVFHRTTGFVHPSIPAGLEAIKAMGATHHFAVDTTADPAAFTPANLARYKAVIFLSTTGDVLPERAQRAALETYIRSGGGYFGIHAAADMGAARDTWPWYRELVGAAFKGHTGARIYSDAPLPPAAAGGARITPGGKLADAPADADDVPQWPVKTVSWEPARIVVEDPTSPLVQGWGPSVTRSDEWYGFRTNPRPNVHVIASLDETSYEPAAGAMGGDHPITWCRPYDGGRSVYTGLGHPKSAWRDPQMLDHVLGGIRLAAGSVPFNCGPK